MGTGAAAVGDRSPFEQPERLPVADYPQGAFFSLSPLGDLEGTITPSDLHYEVHHHGIPEIDPAEYGLLIHGMVDRPMRFTLADLKRFPRVSHTHFMECAGNSFPHLLGPSEEDTAQLLAGLASCSQWVGVPLTTVMKEVGVQPDAAWALFEGMDAGRMARSVPAEELWWGEAMLAYGQNGEALRPAQGYPIRLIVPGTEGNINVKWLHRIEFSDQPWHTRNETAAYSDVRCDAESNCVATQFTLRLDAKSIITWPSGGQQIAEPGFWEISGLAWSGRGTIDRVEVSTDGGATWGLASLDQPVLPKAFTRFRYPWQWDGTKQIIVSRAIDSTGYVQPSRAEALAQYGAAVTIDHYNGTFRWKVNADGRITGGDVG